MSNNRQFEYIDQNQVESVLRAKQSGLLYCSYCNSDIRNHHCNGYPNRYSTKINCKSENCEICTKNGAYIISIRWDVRPRFKYMSNKMKDPRASFRYYDWINMNVCDGCKKILSKDDAMAIGWDRWSAIDSIL